MNLSIEREHHGRTRPPLAYPSPNAAGPDGAAHHLGAARLCGLAGRRSDTGRAGPDAGVAAHAGLYGCGRRHPTPDGGALLQATLAAADIPDRAWPDGNTLAPH